MIAALAGRRIDAADAEEKQFPLEIKDAVYVRIRDFFHKYNVSVLVSSAACGADLLALEAARELGIERHIILPFRREKFRETSVTDRPGDWGELFDEICDEAERRGNLIILKGFENEEEKAYSAVTDAILEHAENLCSPGEKILAVAVWEGKAKDENDETSAFTEKAEARNIEVKEIKTT
jgi:hypothetical protein